MLRTFWPAKSLADLPAVGAVEARLGDWVMQWFGSTARVNDVRVAEMRNLAEVTGFVSGDAVVAIASFGKEFERRLRSQVSSVTLMPSLSRELAVDMVSDLCRQVFKSPHAIEALRNLEERRSIPEDMLEISIESGDGDDQPTILGVSADVVLGTTVEGAPPPAAVDRQQLFAGVAVSLIVEKNIPIAVSDLVGLSIDDFVPIAPVSDVGFKMTVSGKEFGNGYVGHVDNRLAMVIES